MRVAGKKAAKPAKLGSQCRREAGAKCDAEPARELAAAMSRVRREAPALKSARRFVREELAGALPEICEVLIAKTLEGKLDALKLLLAMSAEPKKAVHKAAGPGGAKANEDQGFARRVLDEFRSR